MTHTTFKDWPAMGANLTPAIREYVNTKLDRVIRHFDNVTSVSVILTVEKLNQKAEVTVHVRGKDIHVETTDADLYAAIDLLVDKLDRQVCRHKSKVQNHHHEALKRQDAFLDAA